MKISKHINENSSVIKSVGYDDKTKELFVVFQSNTRYKYKDVPLCIASEFINSNSYGREYSYLIKGQYTSEKLN